MTKSHEGSLGKIPQSENGSLFSPAFFFLRLHLQHMEVPRLGVESERQLQAYASATAELSRIGHLHHSHTRSEPHRAPMPQHMATLDS